MRFQRSPLTDSTMLYAKVASLPDGRLSPALDGNLAHRPVNQQWPTDDVVGRNQPPVAGIVTVVAIVAENEVGAFGDDELAVVNQFLCLDEPLGEAIFSANKPPLGKLSRNLSRCPQLKVAYSSSCFTPFTYTCLLMRRT